MNIGYNLKKRRLTLGYTLEEVAKKVGTSKQTIHRYETGIIANIPSDKIEALAKVLQTTPAYLMGWENQPEEDIYKYKNIIPMPKTKKVPLIGTIACGTPILAVENIECDVDMPENIRADFALRCKGDSMIDAHIYDGDIVYIRKQPIVDNGEIAAVIIDDEATLKRFYREGNKVTLMPCNPCFSPLVYTNEELNNIIIVGKAVGYTSTNI